MHFGYFVELKNRQLLNKLLNWHTYFENILWHKLIIIVYKMKLLLHIYDIHYRYISHTWFPLKWDCKQTRWSCTSTLNKKSTNWIVFMANYALKLIIILSCLIVIQTIFTYPHIFKLYQVLFQLLNVVDITFTLVIEISSVVQINLIYI